MCDIKKLSQIAKPMLVFINVVSFILGIGQISLGCIIATRKISLFGSEDNTNETNKTNSIIVRGLLDISSEDTEIEDTEYYLDMVSIPVIGLGVIIILLNMFGCIGSIKETKRLLIPYMIAVVLVTLAVIAGLTISLLYWDDLKGSIKHVGEVRLRQYQKDQTFTKSWNFTMSNLKCCGVNGWTDFQTLNQTLNRLPKYCCKDQLTDCNINDGDELIPGCFTKIYSEILESYNIHILIPSTEIFLNLFGIVAASLILRKKSAGSKQFWEWKSKTGGFKRDSLL